MQVRLLKDVEEEGKVKQTGRRAAVTRPQRQRDGTVTDVPVRDERAPFLWVKGAVLEMSEASARKYIEAGLAEVATDAD